MYLDEMSQLPWTAHTAQLLVTGYTVNFKSSEIWKYNQNIKWE